MACVLASFCAAAFCHHSAALAASSCTPSPLLYITPRLNCASASPEFACFCNCAERSSTDGVASCFDNGGEDSPQAATAATNKNIKNSFPMARMRIFLNDMLDLASTRKSERMRL